MQRFSWHTRFLGAWTFVNNLFLNTVLRGGSKARPDSRWLDSTRSRPKNGETRGGSNIFNFDSMARNWIIVLDIQQTYIFSSLKIVKIKAILQPNDIFLQFFSSKSFFNHL